MVATVSARARLSGERNVAPLNLVGEQALQFPVSGKKKKMDWKATAARSRRLPVGQAHRFSGRCLGDGKVLEVQGSVSDGLQIEI